MIIDKFRGQHDFLSNFYESSIIYDGVEYPTSEHAYQAAKSIDPAARKYILGCKTPREAKRAGKALTLRENWDIIKIDIMTEIVRDKFTRHPDLAVKLLATGDARLIEGNTWGDIYWGVCNGKGYNHLGKILMQVREELKKAIEDNE